MLITMSAYVVFDRLVVQCTKSEPTSEGAHWTTIILEQIDVSAIDTADEYDLIYVAGQLLSERAKARQAYISPRR